MAVVRGAEAVAVPDACAANGIAVLSGAVAVAVADALAAIVIAVLRSAEVVALTATLAAKSAATTASMPGVTNRDASGRASPHHGVLATPALDCETLAPVPLRITAIGYTGYSSTTT